MKVGSHPGTASGDGTCTYLRLQLALREGHHLLVGHLGEEGSVLVQTEALQPGWDICGARGGREAGGPERGDRRRRNREKKRVMVKGKKRKEKNLYVTTCLIVTANYGLRSLGLALTFWV